MNAPASAAERLFLIDGSGFIFRAYHALPPFTRSDGTPVGAVAGFCNMLYKVLEDAKNGEHPTHLAVIFDAARQTFRSEIYAEYKAHRPPPPDDLIPQFALVRDATRAFNVSCIESPGFEADDLIATYARQASQRGAEVTILSSDKDLMQLVRPGIGMLDPVKLKRIGDAEVMEKFGVMPNKVIDVQALAGDSTDNVPGVPGIGVKTAAQLITEYGDLDTLLARAGEIKQPKRREALTQNADLARISKQLVQLKDDVPLPEPWEELAVKPFDLDKLFGFLREQEFKALLGRVEAKHRGGGAAAPAPTRATAPVAGPSAPAAPIAADAAPAKVDYETVTSEAALDRWVAQATAQGYVGLDTETTSPDPMRAELVGISLALAPGRACYIPVGHRAEDLLATPGSNLPQQLDRNLVVAKLKPLLEDESVLKIGHNIKYDMVVLARQGIGVAPTDDTMVLSYVLDAGRREHDMGALAEQNLQHKTIALSELTGSGRNQVSFDRVPLERATQYAAEEADMAWRLHRLLKRRLVAEHMVTMYETIERPLLPVLMGMEHAGILVDRAELARLSEHFDGRAKSLESEIHAAAGRPFNIGSGRQLGEILFDEMKLGQGRKTAKTDAYSTTADVLEALADEGHKLPALVLDWRQVTKLKSTYTDALQEQINPHTGRVHTCFAMTVAATGRLSSQDPNLQNIPIRTEEGRRIRRAFVAPKGTVLMSADYSQIELRVLAHIAGVDALKDAFKAGIDIHALTASQVFGMPVEGMDPMVRRSAKAINFGIIYGMSAFGLARQLGIPQGEASKYIGAYFQRYPGIRDYMDRAKADCRASGYVTTAFGRKVHMPGINDKNPAKRAFMERASINAPIQGTAADIIKRAMVRIPDALAAAKLKARMLLQVHDELVFEVPEAEVEPTARLVKRVMEGAASLSVPLTVDVGHGPNWDEAH
jgi:DNA polymerase I